MREDAMTLGLLLRQAHRRAAQSLDRALAPLDMSGRHFGILLLLNRDGTSTQRDLLALTGGDKAGMARTVAELEAMGAIEREVDSADRRVVHLALTDVGRETFASAKRIASDVGHELTSRLDDAELRQLLGLLLRVVRTVPDTGAEASGRPEPG